MVLEVSGEGKVSDSYRERNEVEVFKVEKCIESNRIRTIDGRDGWSGRAGEVVNSYRAAHLSCSSGANVDCSVWILTKDKGTKEKLGLVMGNDRGEMRISDEELESLEKILPDGRRRFTGAIYFGRFWIAGDDLLEIWFPLGELVVLWIVE